MSQFWGARQFAKQKQKERKETLLEHMTLLCPCGQWEPQSPVT